MAKYGALVISYNVASAHTGAEPTFKSCQKRWVKAIDRSDVDDSELLVLFDDRDHEEGDIYRTLQAPMKGGTIPTFPINFVLDHNGKVLNKRFSSASIERAKELVIEQSEKFDKELEEAKKAKGAGND